MDERGQVTVEYTDIAPFTKYGVWDLAVSIAGKVGVPERCLDRILEFSLFVDRDGTHMKITYLDQQPLDAAVVIQDFDLLAARKSQEVTTPREWAKQVDGDAAP